MDKLKRKLKLVIVTMAFIVFICSLCKIIYIKYNSYEEQKNFEQLQNRITKIEETQDMDQTQYNNEDIREDVQIPEKVQEIEDVQEEVEEEKKILSKYQALYEENNDLYGWIKIDDTVIDYPVMFTPEDPIYYLHLNWEKEESKEGTPFVDGRTTDETENIIIYAHNMKNGTMFGSLKQYKDEQYYEEHKYIQFDTIYEEAIYEIIAVSKAIVYYDNEPKEGEYLYYKHVELDNMEEFDAYITNAKQNAYYDIEETAEYGDKLITLSTCDYWTENARLIIVAKKITE